MQQRIIGHRSCLDILHEMNRCARAAKEVLVDVREAVSWSDPRLSTLPPRRTHAAKVAYLESDVKAAVVVRWGHEWHLCTFPDNHSDARNRHMSNSFEYRWGLISPETT